MGGGADFHFQIGTTDGIGIRVLPEIARLGIVKHQFSIADGAPIFQAAAQFQPKIPVQGIVPDGAVVFQKLGDRKHRQFRVPALDYALIAQDAHVYSTADLNCSREHAFVDVKAIKFRPVAEGQSGSIAAVDEAVIDIASGKAEGVQAVSSAEVQSSSVQFDPGTGQTEVGAKFVGGGANFHFQIGTTDGIGIRVLPEIARLGVVKHRPLVGDRIVVLQISAEKQPKIPAHGGIVADGAAVFQKLGDRQHRQFRVPALDYALIAQDAHAYSAADLNCSRKHALVDVKIIKFRHVAEGQSGSVAAVDEAVIDVASGKAEGVRTASSAEVQSSFVQIDPGTGHTEV